jgi:hypothetical protein
LGGWSIKKRDIIMSRGRKDGREGRTINGFFIVEDV